MTFSMGLAHLSCRMYIPLAIQEGHREVRICPDPTTHGRFFLIFACPSQNDLLWIRIFLIVSEIDHIVMCLLATCISS